MLADTTVSVVVSVCDHGNVVRSTRCGCPSTSAQTSIPPVPMEPDNSYVTRLGLNSGTACGPRTVVTGGGAENSCTFHINTAPKESATTATNGSRLAPRQSCRVNEGSLHHLSESGLRPRVLASSLTP